DPPAGAGPVGERGRPSPRLPLGGRQGARRSGSHHSEPGTLSFFSFSGQAVRALSRTGHAGKSRGSARGTAAGPVRSARGKATAVVPGVCDRSAGRRTDGWSGVPAGPVRAEQSHDAGGGSPDRGLGGVRPRAWTPRRSARTPQGRPVGPP